MTARSWKVVGAAAPIATTSAAKLRLLVAHRERAYLDVLFRPEATAETIRRRWDLLREARVALADAERGERQRRRRKRRGKR